MRRSTEYPRPDNRRRLAFTLIELLIVILIFLILTAVTVASFNYSIDTDRMRAGARQLQSVLIGARDKAIFAKEIRGVRLILDPPNGITTVRTASAVQYIGSPQREVGTLTFDSTGQLVTLATGTQWTSLYRRGFLRVGTQIQIPRDTGTWFTISTISGNTLSLNRPNRDLASSSTGFVLQLAPGILGDSQPIQLPRNVAIDLDGSRVPASWRIAGSYIPQMDILFTPRGTIVGDSASVGVVHLHIADSTDISKWNDPQNGITGRGPSYNMSLLPLVPADNSNSTTPVVRRDRIVLTVSCRTGNVSVHPINPANANNDSIADDPFFFAETGQVANK